MKFIALALAALSLSTPAHAQQIPDEAKAEVRRVVRELLRDPQSANFRWLDRPAGETTLYCGYYNAKNRYGGYVGFQIFSVVLFGPERGWRASYYQMPTSETEVRATELLCTRYGFDINGPLVDD